MGAALAGLGIAKALKDLIAMGGELNRIQDAVSQTAGGLKALQGITDFAKSSAFSVDALYKNFDKLRTLGVPVGQAADAVKTLAEAVKNGTNSQDDLNAAVEAYGNMLDRVSLKSLQQFGAAGINVMKLLREATHKSAHDIRQDQENLSGETVRALIIAQAKINNLMKGAGASDVSDKVNQLKSAFGGLGQVLDKALGPSLVKIIDLLIKVVNLATEAVRQFDKLPQGAKDVAVGTAVGGAGLLGAAGLVGAGATAYKYGKAGVAAIRGLGAAGAVGAAAAGEPRRRVEQQQVQREREARRSSLLKSPAVHLAGSLL